MKLTRSCAAERQRLVCRWVDETGPFPDGNPPSRSSEMERMMVIGPKDTCPYKWLSWVKWGGPPLFLDEVK